MKIAIITAFYAFAAMSLIAVSVTIFTVGVLWFGDFMAWLAAKQAVANFAALHLAPAVVLLAICSLGMYFAWLAVAVVEHGFAGNKQLA